MGSVFWHGDAIYGLNYWMLGVVQCLRVSMTGEGKAVLVHH